MNEPFVINGTNVGLGENLSTELFVASQYDYTPLSIPVRVIRGKKYGPVLFVSAAIHGDEINGVEIIRRLLQSPQIRRIRGTLIAIPIVNVFGFNNGSRYLPDRRDLNRSFPGSENGSLASQMANLFVEEIVKKCTHGIDLHTGAIHRTNYPQIRADLSDEKTSAFAKAFDATVTINSRLRDGSLRDVAGEMKVPTLLFEGGEALRFDEYTIKTALHGIISAMRNIEMLPAKSSKAAADGSTNSKQRFVADSTHWVRAPRSGVLRILKKLGSFVEKDTIVGKISNPFGEESEDVVATYDGVIIGNNNLPLVNRGDALFHVACLEKVADSPLDFVDERSISELNYEDFT